MGKFSDHVYPAHIQACIDGFRRDLPLILEGKDPHVYLRDLSGWESPTRGYIPPLQEIFQACCKYYDVNPTTVKRKNKLDREYSQIRKMYCYLAKTRTNKTSAQIGKLINRDGTTVGGNYKLICKEISSTFPEERNQETIWSFHAIEKALNKPAQYLGCLYL